MAAARRTTSSTAPERVLLIGGTETAAEIRAQLAEQEGLRLELDHVLGHQEALERAAAQRYALVIAERTEQQPQPQELRALSVGGAAVLLLVDRGDERDGQLATGNGASGYLIKQDLRRTLRPLLYAALRGRATVTALRREKDEADQLAKTKSEFLANMSHEIRTPLHTITGMNELLLGTNLDAEQREYGTSIGFAAETLLQLINDILDFSKIEAGRLELECIDFDMQQVVEEAVDLVSLEVHKKGLQIASYVAGDAPHLVRGDPTRLRQVLVNLITNAVKFTESGEIAIKVGAMQLGTHDRHNEVAVKCVVRDTGIGIPEAKREELFGAFSQVDSSTTRKYGGTGLGLAISRQLVEQMGGSIGVDSVEGEGSSFWFTATFLTQRLRSRYSGLARRFFGGLRVLVVDDNATACGFVSQYLRGWGCRVTGASNGEQALQLLRESSAERRRAFHLVLVDLMMPGMDGWHVGSEMHADNTIMARRVLMTPIGMSGDEAKMKLLGWFDGYLSKPVKKAALLETITHVLWAEVALDELKTEEETADPVDRITGRFRVLAAEDHEVNRALVRTLLERLGHEVTVAEDGQEALAAVAAGSFDLIFLDIQMPKRNGYEVAEELRERGIKTPIVALTAHAMKSERDRCIAAGMDDFLPKPFTSVTLQPVLERWLPAAPGASPAGGEQALPVEGDLEALELVAGDGPSDGVPAADATADATDRPVFDWEGAVETFLGEEETVRELLASFSTKVAKQLEEMAAALEADDVDALRERAHSIKGSSWNLHAFRLGDAAHSLESAAKEHLEGTAANGAPPFTALVEAVRSQYQAFVADASPHIPQVTGAA